MPDTPSSPPNRELVVYALYLLGGESRRVHTEAVAVKCHELFPDAFSWTRYPQFPDKDVVRVALTDARKPKYGGVVEGRAGQRLGQSAKTKREPTEDGWTLTEAGALWVKEHESVFNEYVGVGAAKEHRQKLLKQLARIRAHRLFGRYEEDPERFSPMIGDVADLLRCRVDAEPRIWESRFDKARKQAMSTGQEDVLDFISLCQKAVNQQL